MKKFYRYLVLVVVAGLVTAVAIYYPRLDILTGFASKSVASGVFVAKRTLESVEQGDNDFFPVLLSSNEVNSKERSVTSSVFGIKKRKAIFVEGLGAILVNKEDDGQGPFDIPRRQRSFVLIGDVLLILRIEFQCCNWRTALIWIRIKIWLPIFIWIQQMVFVQAGWPELIVSTNSIQAWIVTRIHNACNQRAPGHREYLQPRCEV